MSIVTFSDIGIESYHEDREHSLKLFCGDCLQLLPQFPQNSIDMIFADPPYFLSNGGITCHAGRMVSVNKGKWDVSHGTEENHKFNLSWLSECQRILTENGVKTLIYNFNHGFCTINCINTGQIQIVGVYRKKANYRITNVF